MRIVNEFQVILDHPSYIYAHGGLTFSNMNMYINAHGGLTFSNMYMYIYAHRGLTFSNMYMYIYAHGGLTFSKRGELNRENKLFYYLS